MKEEQKRVPLWSTTLIEGVLHFEKPIFENPKSKQTPDHDHHQNHACAQHADPTPATHPLFSLSLSLSLGIWEWCFGNQSSKQIGIYWGSGVVDEEEEGSGWVGLGWEILSLYLILGPLRSGYSTLCFPITDEKLFHDFGPQSFGVLTSFFITYLCGISTKYIDSTRMYNRDWCGDTTCQLPKTTEYLG